MSALRATSQSAPGVDIIDSIRRATHDARKLRLPADASARTKTSDVELMCRTPIENGRNLRNTPVGSRYRAGLVPVA